MKKNFSLFLFIVVFAITAKSQTTIPPGYISGTWTLSGSPYLITGSVKVPNGSTLTIEPGVTVNFQGHYKLLVAGRLLAIGTVTDSIFFTASNTSTGWYGIRFDSTLTSNDSSKFLYCSLRWGKATGIGSDEMGGGFMFNEFSKAIISHSLIRNCSSAYPPPTFGGAIRGINACPTLSFNRIVNCTGGIYLTNITDQKITDNIISHNNGYGIVWTGPGNTVNFSNNVVTYNTSCGVYCGYGSPLIKNNNISHNNTSNQNVVGGLWCDNSNPVISNNVINYNLSGSSGYGGGLFLYFCTPLITHNFILNNTAPNGGGILSVSSTMIISNNVITNNSAIYNSSSTTSGYGGGICSWSSTIDFQNNTIANNSATFGGGISFSGSSSANVSNTIIYGNSAFTEGSQVFIVDEPTDPNFSYCNIQGASSAFGLNGNFYSGTYSNNIDVNSFFIAPSGGSGTAFNGEAANWSLQSSSACINSGNPAGSYPTTDIAGHPRVSFSVIDIGAYEFQNPDGINETKLHQLSIYPNPFSSSTTIHLADLKDARVNLYDSYGKQLRSIINITGNEIQVKRDNLPNGIYFITLIQEGKIIATEKLVITN
jgi:hypothetical protein